MKPLIYVSLGLAVILGFVGCDNDDNSPIASPDTVPPASISDLAIASLTDSTVTLLWTAPGNDLDLGTAAQYDIRYSDQFIATDGSWIAANQIDGCPTPSEAGVLDSMVVEGIAQDGDIYFAIRTVDGAQNWSGLSNVVMVDLSTGTDDPDINWQEGFSLPPSGNGLSGFGQAFAVYNNTLIVGGRFFQAGPLDVNHIASWNGSDWESLGSGIELSYEDEIAQANVHDMCTYGSNLVVAGYFDMAGGTPADALAAWDGEAWTAVGTNISGVHAINALVEYRGMLVAGGKFSKISDTVSANNIAQWNGEEWMSLGGRTNGNDFGLTVYNGYLVAGGSFEEAGGISTGFVAMWDGERWSSMGSGISGGPDSLPILDPVVYGYVRCFGLYNGNLYAGGAFSVAGDRSADCLARWNGMEWISLDINVYGHVYAISEYNNNLAIGGYLGEWNGVESGGLVSYDGANWGTFGSGLSGWSGEPTVAAVTEFQNGLFVAGRISRAGGKISTGFAIWRE